MDDEIELARAITAQVPGALLLDMPPWPSRAPTRQVAIATVRDTRWHVLAVVDVYTMIVSPPPSLTGRFGRQHRWSRQEPAAAHSLAKSLAELASAWWAHAADEVGVMDVAGALTHRVATLDPTPGAFGNYVYEQPAPGLEGVSSRATLGRADRDAGPRSPTLADVFTEGDHVRVLLLDAHGATTTTTLLRTTEHLAAALPRVFDLMSGADDAAVRWRATVGRLAPVAAGLTARLGPGWSITAPFEVDLARRPWVDCARVDHHLRVVGPEPLAVEIGSQSLPVDSADIEAALRRDAAMVRPSRLLPGLRYRVRQAFGGAHAGEVIAFVENVEVRHPGGDAYVFHVVGRQHVITLSDSDDARILGALHDWLEPAAPER